MSVLTTIGGIPLFSTPGEALEWGLSVGLQNFHTHIYAGQTGYMAGASHNQATSNQELNGNNQNNGINGEVNGGTIDPSIPSRPTTPAVETTETSRDY